MPKVGVCLSGCGFKDGAEIHESVLTILALDRAGAEIVFMAPDSDQFKVVNHLTGNDMTETRNVLVESARIARGDISDVAQISTANLDALIFPGGFGAALNLCDFGAKGANCDINPAIVQIIKEMIEAKKPVGVICIAPAMMARAMKELNLKTKLTIGNDPGTAVELEKLGATHLNCQVDDIIVDKEHKIVSTPAYMLANNISETASGIGKAVAKVLELI